MIILSNIRVISADMYFFLYLDNILNLTAYFIIKIVELISLIFYLCFPKSNPNKVFSKLDHSSDKDSEISEHSDRT